MELLQRLQLFRPPKSKPDTYSARPLLSPKQRVLAYIEQIKSIGFSDDLADYEKRKLGIFNLLNFVQLVSWVLIPLIGMFTVASLPTNAWIIAILPGAVSVSVLIMNSRRQHKLALMVYFIFYPVFTCIIYIQGINLGVELSFVLYGILSVFFIQEIGYMIFSIAFSMISYFVLSVVLKDYQYQLKSINLLAYLVNQGLAILYIFYGLFLIKKENARYHSSIEKQSEALNEQAILLREQAVELADLNTLNNKLFSVISHDLKAPMYALRNFFLNAKELKLPAREIRNMLPDVINDLNYTTGLMENLLHWAKSQMQSNGVRAQDLDMNGMIEDNIQLLRIQADAKKIMIERKTSLPVYAHGDKDMINLVLRNLITNAIKYTPMGGRIIIGTHEHDQFAEIYIQDTGRGISREEMRKINENNFYTTKGTASEAGTGLGLMLCREFLDQNNGRMMIESEPGQGSTFSFTLPQPQ
jgi:two-component system, sensor histidine kinase and response regulator